MPWPSWWSSEKIENAPDDTITNAIQHDLQNVAAAAQRNISDQSILSSSTITSSGRIFADSRTIAASLVLTTALFGCYRIYGTFLRRIPEAINIDRSYFHKRSVFGKVTRVGDGDNFRIFHTPGGWLAGWGWLPWRQVPTDRKLLKNQTIHIRLAGIDAPELSHFGRPAQPYSKKALDWLTSYVLGRRVRAHVYKIDQYSRVVGTVYVWKGLRRRDIGLQMLKAGLATVYEANSGAEFGKGLEHKYRSAEDWAKRKKKGMWATSMKDFESPRAYKNKYRAQDTTAKE